METLEQLKEYITELGYEDVPVFDNPSYVTAFIGMSNNGNAVYDFDKMVEYLIETDGMEYEEAVEFIELEHCLIWVNLHQLLFILQMIICYEEVKL